MLEYSLFHQLPDWTQAEVLAKKGNLLGRRQHQDCMVSLYSLNNFFIEVWEKSGIRVTTSFKQTAHPLTILEPYADQVSIELLLE